MRLTHTHANVGRTRRQIVTGAGAVLLAMPFVRSAGAAADALRVQLSWVSNVESAGLFAAASKGYFTDAGLAIEFVPGGPQIDPIGGVASGGVDIAMVSAPLSIVAARSRGVPLVAIGAQFAKSPLGIAARADRGITLPTGFKGAKVGYQQVNRNLLLAILKANGLSENDITTTVVTGEPTMLIERRIDLMTVSVLNVPLAMQVRGVDATSWLASDLGVPMQGGIVTLLESTLKQKRDAVTRFMKAVGRGLKYNIANPDEIATTVVSEYGSGLSLPHQIAYNKAQIPLMLSQDTREHGLLWLDMSAWKKTAEIAVETGVITAPLNIEQFVDPSVLHDAELPKA